MYRVIGAINGNRKDTILNQTRWRVQRGLIGEVIGRFEKAGLKIRAMKMVHLTREKAHAFYVVHQERPFYDSLTAQGAAAIHVDWRPPAGGNEAMMSILAKMRTGSHPGGKTS